MAVVLYHLWPHRLTGGFVGVDVFFVISGYLITGHMYRELLRPDGFSVLTFWARRVRRLLPAAFTVLLGSLIAVYIWVPQTLWDASAKQISASALYVQNWILAADSVDYSALNADATIVQHYWSLSIEEQFYIGWPLLMLAFLWLASRINSRFPIATISPRSTLISGLSVVALISFLFSIQETAANPAAAYFVTGTRVWEFAVGGLVALIFIDRKLTGIAPVTMAWVGMAAIVTAALFYTGDTAFPGYTALLPVLGTAALLCCHGSAKATSPAWLLSRKPLTFLGDISYAIYLWHWPLIVIAPAILGIDLNWQTKVGILAVSILLSWLTKVTIEDPARVGPLLKKNWASYSFAGIGIAAVVGLSFGLQSLGNATAPAVLQLQSTSHCIGPGALNPVNGCANVMGVGAPLSSPVTVAKENKEPTYPGCQSGGAGTELLTCNLGVPLADARATVALVGDSHAGAWYPAMDEVAKENRWHVIAYSKASCPVTAALRILDNETTSEDRDDCHGWGQRLSDTLIADKSISIIFTASYSSAYKYESAPGLPLQNPGVDGFTSMWARWQAAGKKVVAFDDVPRTNGEYIPTCLERNSTDPLKCSTPIAEALPANLNITKAAEEMAPKGVTRIKLRDYFCDDTLCYPVVGSVIVYRDYSHISAEYSRALAPFINAQLGDLSGTR